MAWNTNNFQKGLFEPETGLWQVLPLWVRGMEMKWALHTSQNWSLTIRYSLVSYSGHFILGGSYSSPSDTICYVNGKGTVDLSTVIRWFKKFHSGCKNNNDQTRSGKPKTGFWDCAPSQRNPIWQVALGEYQASLTGHNLVRFVTFIT